METLTITFEGTALSQLPKEQSIKAHLIQFGALYLFGASYTHSKDGKVMPKQIRNFWDFLSIYFWDIRPKMVASTSGSIRNKPLDGSLKELWDEIMSNNS